MSCRCLACYIIITIDHQSFFCCLRSRTSRTFCACTFWRLLSLSVEKPVFWETLSSLTVTDEFGLCKDAVLFLQVVPTRHIQTSPANRRLLPANSACNMQSVEPWGWHTNLAYLALLGNMQCIQFIYSVLMQGWCSGAYCAAGTTFSCSSRGCEVFGPEQRLHRLQSDQIWPVSHRMNSYDSFPRFWWFVACLIFAWTWLLITYIII